MLPIAQLYNILTETKQVTYLGTVLSNDVSPHIDARIKAVRSAFYGLQGAGLCKNGVNASTLRHNFNTALNPLLLFGCANLNINKKHLLQIDKQLAKLLKSAIGLPKWCKNYNLMNAFDTKLISTAVLTLQLSTLVSAMILEQNPPDKTPRSIPHWTKTPGGQNPTVDKTPLPKPLPKIPPYKTPLPTPPPRQNPLTKTPPDKTPRTTPPPNKNPPGQTPLPKPPRQNPPTKTHLPKPHRQNPPTKTPRTKIPPNKRPLPKPTRQNPPLKPPRTKPL